MVKKDLGVYLKNIPSGRLRELIGQDISSAIVDYHIYNRNLNINYVDILLNKYGKSILFQRDVFRNFIIFLDDNHIKQIADRNGINYTAIEDARKNLSERIFGYKNLNFSESIIDILGLCSETYLPAQTKAEDNFESITAPSYQLHPYQKNIKDKAIETLLNPALTSRMVIHMPTGAGKTKTAMEIVSDYLRCRSVLGGFDQSVFIVWLAHSKELCDQALETFQNTWKLRGDSAIEVFRVYGDHEYSEDILKVERAICFAGFQKFNALINSSNPLQKSIKKKILDKVKLVVVDEAHKSLAETYGNAINILTKPAGVQLVGLTATPGRSKEGDSENNLLAQFFHSSKIGLVDELGVPVKDSIAYLQKLGVLARIQKEDLISDYQVKLTDEQIRNLRLYGDEKLAEILKDLAVNPGRNNLIIQRIKGLVSDNESILVFACNVQHCIILQTLLKSEGIDSATILSSTSRLDREESIKKFKSNELNVLINYGVLTTGFDAPNLTTLIIARPTTSMVLYSQMVGRALRGKLNNGHEVNKLIDVKDNIHMGDVSEMFNFYDDLWN